jgi:LDH2 family malate/lactate/ureidoglycolate dehydrogenase
MALIDGKNTFGQVVARDAMALCLRKVRQHGLALVSCVNTGHVGRVGEYALTAAREGFIAVCCVNGGAIVAPFGSKSRVLGTNPICCAVPVEVRAYVPQAYTTWLLPLACVRAFLSSC